MWDVVCAQMNRKVGKKGNDRRKNKINGKQEAKVLENSLGWASVSKDWDDEAQGPGVDMGSGAAWVKDADLESSCLLPCPRPEGKRTDSIWDQSRFLTWGPLKGLGQTSGSL